MRRAFYDQSPIALPPRPGRDCRGVHLGIRENADESVICAIASLPLPAVWSAQESLPFPPTPSGSKEGPTIARSAYSPKKPVSRLPANAPNVLIIMRDDVGPALPQVYGGPIHAPTLARIANSGVSCNSFHNAAM